MSLKRMSGMCVCVGGGGGVKVSPTMRTLDLQVIINMHEKMNG